MEFLYALYDSKLFRFCLILLAASFVYRSCFLQYQSVKSLDGKYELEYVERVVNATDESAPLPMVIAFHGAGDNPKHFLQFFDGFKTPMRVIALAAPSSRKSKSQNEHERFKGESAAYVLEALQQRYRTRDKPTLLGFSMGAGTVYYLAAHYPNRIKNAIPICGRLSSDLLPDGESMGRKPNIYIFHAKQDSLIPIEQGKAAARYFKNHNYEVAFEEYPGDHGIPDDVLTQVDHLLAQKI